MNTFFRVSRRICLLILLAFCGIMNSLYAQHRYDFSYEDRNALLSDGWDFIAFTSERAPRNTEQTTGAVISYDQQEHPGVMRIPVDMGDLWEGINNTRNTLFRDLPSDWTSIRLKISSFNPTQSNQQATLVAYQDDDNYVQISRTFEAFNRVMFTSEIKGIAVNLNSVEESATSNIYLRLDRDTLSETIASYYSTDGTNWTKVGTVGQSLSYPRLAIETGASPGGFPNADISWAEVSTEQLPQVTDELHAHPGSLVFNAEQGDKLTDIRTVFLFTSLGNIIGWKQSMDVSWLRADLLNGITDGILRLRADPSGLMPGVYHGNLTIESSQSTTGAVIIPVSLIVNPDVPVKTAVWKDNKDGAMSVSVDDGQPSAFAELCNNGFKGTYVMNGLTPPSFYTEYYNAGMELGSHLVNHPCNPVSDEILKSAEILPNITNLSTDTPVPLNKIISLVWPCGYTNYREQAVASEFFLSARGYNINKLEEASPENIMNLKSYNSHEHPPFPPSDLKTMVDSAILLHKWFNLVLHNMTNDDGAIYYAHSKNIWVTTIGNTVKYILQRDRIILDSYMESPDGISFNVSRLPVPPSASRTFEQAFGPDDMITLIIDIEDDRLVGSVRTDGVINPFQIVKSDGNRILLTNVKPDPSISKSVEIKFLDEHAIPVTLSDDTLNFNTIVNRNPESQRLVVQTDGSDTVSWTAYVTSGSKNWKLNITPYSGTLNDTISISVISKGLPAGDYNRKILITSPEGRFYPYEIEVNLEVNPNILRQNYPNPFDSYTWIEYDLPENSIVKLEILNFSGQKCETLVDQFMTSGPYKIKWDSRDFPAGIYFLTIRTNNFSETIKMALIK